MTGDLSFWIGAVVVAAILVTWLKRWIATSPSAIVTGPGVIKTHDVECRFSAGGRRYGKLGQDRWSDGQERFSLVLRNLPAGNEPVKLYRGAELLSQFERSGQRFEFRWKGMAGEDIPRFAIGEELRIECGELTMSGIVEAD